MFLAEKNKMINIVTCDEAIASGRSPWAVLSIVKFHREEIRQALKNKQTPSEYNIQAIPLIQELARQMFVKLKKQKEFPNFHYEKAMSGG